MEPVSILGDGIRLHASRWEPSIPHNGLQILALHGFTGDGKDFDPLARLTQGQFRWNALDLPGHGLSDAPIHPAIYSTTRNIRHLERTERELGLNDYILIGYSMGARLALSYALENSKKIRALVLIGGSPGIRTEQERKQRRIADEKLASRILQIPMSQFIQEWNDQSIITSQNNIDVSFRDSMLQRRASNRPQGLANSLRAFGTGIMPQLWDKLKNLNIPTLLVSGAEDIKFSVIAREMEFNMRYATRSQIFGAGHCAHLEQPGRFSRLLEEFTHQALAA